MSLFRRFTYFLILVALSLNLYIYTYPSLNPEQCSWTPHRDQRAYGSKSKRENMNGFKARILKVPYLGDLLHTYFFTQEKVLLDVPDVNLFAIGDPQINGNWPSTPYIKRLDNYGNDHYLGHIYKVMKTRLQPTHVAVLGDLFSSQWIGDSEFFNRTRRYVTRLFDQPDEQREYVLNYINTHEVVDWVKFHDRVKPMPLKDHEYGYENVYDWNTKDYAKRFENEPLFLNVSGNHDIGYSGDATWQHMARYSTLFGKDNFWIEYERGTPQAWRIVVLNSLLLEGPALQPEFVDYTWEFLYQLFERKFKGATILLTHVPFYKKEGLCVDGPYHDYYEEGCPEPYKLNCLRSQNHLKNETTQRVLNLIFDEEYPGIILTGHDHEGCETYYNKDPKANWYATKKPKEKAYIKEVTVRAMMGDYGGNVGLVTGHFRKDIKRWEYDYSLCPFIVQHVWWATKVVSICAALFWSVALLFDL